MVCLCVLMTVVVVLCPCSLLLDNERWKQAEVPAEFQDLVNSIADGRITLPERKIPGTQKTLKPSTGIRSLRCPTARPPETVIRVVAGIS